MERFIEHLEFAKILGFVAVGVMIFTVITHFIFQKNRVVRYIPGIIFIIIGLYNLLYLGGQSSSLDGVNRLLIVTITMISGFVGISTGLIIGVFRKGKE
ncbi:hypothetical protein [Tissierella sp.]|uniref:hypothetical protein n=1 Tax=Tissierella sp. TaxID=41274 RepID=UPI002862B608|nr:hypothetical protein [Tissierella sp.]MDR7857280.1 hypothetical protein [Tissierella sp.]